MFRFVPSVFSDSTEQLSKTPSFARRLQAKSGVAVYTGISEFELIRQVRRARPKAVGPEDYRRNTWEAADRFPSEREVPI